jgi:hypothetical protein
LRVSYRVTGVLVIATYLATLGIEHFYETHRTFTSRNDLPPLTMHFDPCTMRGETSPFIKGMILIWLGSFSAILVQGLRNLGARMYLPIVCILAYLPILRDAFPWVRDCYTLLGLIDFLACVGSVCLMCAHHLVQRPIKAIDRI